MALCQWRRVYLICNSEGATLGELAHQFRASVQQRTPNHPNPPKADLQCPPVVAWISQNASASVSEELSKGPLADDEMLLRIRFLRSWRTEIQFGPFLGLEFGRVFLG